MKIYNEGLGALHIQLNRLLLSISQVLSMLILPTLALAHPPSDPSSFYSNFNEIALIDQDDHAFQVAKLAGKVTLYNFIFTHCSNVCPIQTKQLSDIQKSLSADTRKHVLFVSVSLDPLNDTPAVLKAFAQKNGVDFNGWSFVTGKPQDIQKLSEKLGLYDKRKEAEQKDIKRPDGHMTHLWLVNSDGQLMQRYIGNNIDAKRLTNEISTLVTMKSTTSAK
jgi:cytochrome oxidase Cu insertion factor (SCO1/SenC/PrrC family)